MKNHGFEVNLKNKAMSWFQIPFYELFIRRLHLEGDENILDFGSGSGNLALLISRRLNRGGRITCLDISEEWIEIARKRLKKCRNAGFLSESILDLEVGENIYDLIICHNSIHHVPREQRLKTVLEMKKALKPKGRIALKEPVKRDHGMSMEDIDALMNGVGMNRISLFKETFARAITGEYSKAAI